MNILKRILLNRTAMCLLLAVFQSCQISTATQQRILSGPRPGAIPIRDIHTNPYNNDLGPPAVAVPVMEPEGTSTVSTIKQILQDRYLRSPVAVVVDTAPPFLHRTKKLLRAVVSTYASMNLLLIPYNSTGIGPVQKPMDKTQLQNAVHDLRSVTPGYSENKKGVAFYSILKATEKVPYDSAILLFTGRAAEDEDLAAITAENLTSKRCKLYVVWLEPPPIHNPGIETLYAEVALRTGGAFYFTKASDFLQADPADDTDTTPFTEMEEVTEVTLAMRLGLTGHVRLPIQVDKTVTSLLVTIEGPVNSAHLQDPFGNAMDLTQNASSRYKVLVRDDNILSIRLDTGVGEPGRWMLKTAGADAQTHYNVIVQGTSSLHFNASTTVVPSAHTNGSEDEGSVNPNIQFQLSVPENIATIQNVSLVNKEGNKLGHLQYNPGADLLPAFNIPENKLSSEPLYLMLTASTRDGEVVERLVEVEHQPQSYAVPYTVDVLAQSTLEVQPGDRVNLVFNVTNHHSELALLTFTYQVKDYPYIPPQLFIRPVMGAVPPGKSIQVMVTGLIYRNIQPGTTATIEFLVRPYRRLYPTVNRAVYLFIGVPQVSDSDRPTINYSVKNNCKNVPQERCSTSAWNIEATVQDSRSGLISVTSNPRGIEFLTSFIAGTKAAVPISYSASCCAPTVDIKAADAKGNYVTQHIDANAGMSLLYKSTLTVNSVCVFILVLVYG
ncbi:hypothetical protein B7P43_G17282, partial [Cryptotermes secundus]